MTDKQLSRALRNHEDRAIVDEHEIDLRVAFDELIGAVSLSEIGWLSAWSKPEQYPDSFLSFVRSLMTREAALTYMIKHYPVRLPILALGRLSSGDGIVISDGHRMNPALTFELLRPRLVEFINDEDAWAFLDLMDDYDWDYDFEDLIDDLGDVNKVMWCLGGRTARRRPPGLSAEAPAIVRGYWVFLNFCLLMAERLKRLESQTPPMLASAYWHFFSYWVDEIYNEKNSFQKAGKNLMSSADSGFAKIREERDGDLADVEQWKRAWLHHMETLEGGLRFIRESAKEYRGPIAAEAARVIRTRPWEHR